MVSRSEGKRSQVLGYYDSAAVKHLQLLSKLTRVPQSVYLREALDDLLEGRKHDLEASQQEARRQLEQLMQALALAAENDPHRRGVVHFGVILVSLLIEAHEPIACFL